MNVRNWEAHENAKKKPEARFRIFTPRSGVAGVAPFRVKDTETGDTWAECPSEARARVIAEALTTYSANAQPDERRRGVAI